MMQSERGEFLHFLKKSPTCFHACHEIEHELKDIGFQELIEKNEWEIHAGGKYFVQRGASLIAFTLPKKKPTACVILGAHTDSPCLKLKPNGEFEKEGLVLLNFEVYGSPILASWIGKDLVLAGKIFYEEGQSYKSELVHYKRHPIFISHVAIHLDRQVNEQGLLLNKQEHLSAIACHRDFLGDAKTFLEHLSQKKNVIHAELFAHPLEEARVFGLADELVAGYRLDNLASCYAALQALKLSATENSQTKIKMIAFWNHEEVGSETQEGASSSFFLDTLERINYLLGQDKQNYLRLKANSMTLSIDVAHGAHPTYSEKYEPRHKVQLGAGVCLKMNAQERYASNGEVTAHLIHLARKEGISIQPYLGRNDIPSGSTIGPLHAARTGIRSVDIGIPLLGMHASRELVCLEDYHSLIAFLSAVLD